MSNIHDIIGSIASNPKLILTDDYEIVAQKITGQNKRFTNGKEVLTQKNEYYWISLRLKYRSRPGKAVVTFYSRGSFDSLVERAMEMAKLSTPDPWFYFPLLKKPLNSFEHIPTISECASVYETIPHTFSVVEECYDSQVIETVIKRKEEKFTLTQFQKFNSAKFSVLSNKPAMWLKDHRLTSSDFSHKKDWLMTLINHAEKISNSKFLKERGEFDIILTPRVLAVILQNIVDFFILGKSPLLEKETIFSEFITILDNKNITENSYFDLEGVFGNETVVIDKGNLNTLLSDSYSARKENKVSTGNLFRKLNKTWPEINVSLLYIKPSEHSFDSMLKELKNGFLIEGVFFIERLNERGRILLSCYGWRVMNGNLLEYFRDVKICIDVIELFKRVTAVGNDIEYFERFGAPSVLFEKVSLD